MDEYTSVVSIFLVPLKEFIFRGRLEAPWVRRCPILSGRAYEWNGGVRVAIQQRKGGYIFFNTLRMSNMEKKTEFSLKIFFRMCNFCAVWTSENNTSIQKNNMVKVCENKVSIVGFVYTFIMC